MEECSMGKFYPPLPVLRLPVQELPPRQSDSLATELVQSACRSLNEYQPTAQKASRMNTYKFSPSDLTFTWDECRFCFYMKVKHQVAAPKGIFPGIFSKMGSLTSGFYLGRSAAVISENLPPGIIKFREKNVKSAPIIVPWAESQCYLSGRFDAVIEFEDGSYGLVDYKTSEAKDEHVPFYSRQLSAYAYALENPAPGALSLAPITRMGLFVITPQRFEYAPAGETIFVNRTSWMDVPRDDHAFLSLLGEILSVLDAPTPPPPGETCTVCAYRQQMLELNL